MDSFSTYQKAATATAIYPNAGTGDKLALFYTALGLASEAGEVAGKAKKILRGDADASPDLVAAELQDVLWYVAALATELGYELGNLAEANLAKLASRQERGVIQGSGDDR